ncbi:MAG: hypothetical protein HC808_05710 [Candidatus Competibacteraceae bacterium]|nr:hypothetical protein [Candidatus Competibacteraceae bacterium]
MRWIAMAGLLSVAAASQAAWRSPRNDDDRAERAGETSKVLRIFEVMSANLTTPEAAIAAAEKAQQEINTTRTTLQSELTALRTRELEAARRQADQILAEHARRRNGNASKGIVRRPGYRRCNATGWRKSQPLPLPRP